MIDLHVHSNASDGTDSPAELVARAARAGLRALALTDHDTLAGLREARETGLDVEVIAGVEVEARAPRGQLHILGLDMAGDMNALEEMLHTLRASRSDRNERIAALMEKDGLRSVMEGVRAIAGNAVVGRPHFARFLVKEGVARSVQDAFDRFLAEDRRYYLPRSAPNPEAVFRAISACAGRAVVAHPFTMRLSMEELRIELARMRSVGLDGVEAYHSDASPAECRAIEDIARSLDLRVTAGSDFHGPNRPGRRLGHTSGGLPISDRYLEELRA
jgi:3',5'-nucleoside bisphosphate phosphatase